MGQFMKHSNLVCSFQWLEQVMNWVSHIGVWLNSASCPTCEVIHNGMRCRWEMEGHLTVPSNQFLQGVHLIWNILWNTGGTRLWWPHRLRRLRGALNVKWVSETSLSRDDTHKKESPWVAPRGIFNLYWVSDNTTFVIYYVQIWGLTYRLWYIIWVSDPLSFFEWVS